MKVYFFINKDTQSLEFTRITQIPEVTATVKIPKNENDLVEQYKNIEKKDCDVIVIYGDVVCSQFCASFGNENQKLKLKDCTHVLCMYGQTVPERFYSEGKFYVIGQTSMMNANAFSVCLNGELRERIFGEDKVKRFKQDGCRSLIIYQDDQFGNENLRLIKKVLEIGSLKGRKPIDSQSVKDWLDKKECPFGFSQEDMLLPVIPYDLIYFIGNGLNFLKAVEKWLADAKACIFNEPLTVFVLSMGCDDNVSAHKSLQTIRLKLNDKELNKRLKFYYIAFSDGGERFSYLRLSSNEMLKKVSETLKSINGKNFVKGRNEWTDIGQLKMATGRLQGFQYLCCLNDDYFGTRFGWRMGKDPMQVLDGITQLFVLGGEVDDLFLQEYFRQGDKRENFIGQQMKIGDFVSRWFDGVISVSFRIAELKSQELSLLLFDNDKHDRIDDLCRALWAKDVQMKDEILQINCDVEAIECNNVKRFYFRDDNITLPFGFWNNLGIGQQCPVAIASSLDEAVHLFAEEGKVVNDQKMVSCLTRVSTEYKGYFIYIMPEVNELVNRISRFVVVTTQTLSSEELLLLSVFRSRFSARASSWLENERIQRENRVTWRSQALQVQKDLGVIISRNFSHNIGSHVLATLSHSPKIAINDRLLYQYVEQRMHYLMDATSEFPQWFVAMPLVGSIIRTFLSQTHLLNYIAISEGLKAWDFKEAKGKKGNCDARIKVHVRRLISESDASNIWDGATVDVNFIKYPGEEGFGTPIEFNKDVCLAMPGGISGCHAFFNILENIIRNAAKHSWANYYASNGKKTIENLDIFIDYIEDKNRNEVTFRVFDGVSDVDTETGKGYSLIEQQNKRLSNALWGDKKSNIKYRGLAEMRISAGFLLGKTLTDIGKFVVSKEENIKAIVARDDKGISHLGYEFMVKKTMAIVLVVDEYWAQALEEVLGSNLEEANKRLIVYGLAVVMRKGGHLNPKDISGYEYVIVAFDDLESQDFAEKQSLFPFRTMVVGRCDNGIGEVVSPKFDGRVSLMDLNDFRQALSSLQGDGMEFKTLVYRTWIEYLFYKRLGLEKANDKNYLFNLAIYPHQWGCESGGDLQNELITSLPPGYYKNRVREKSDNQLETGVKAEIGINVETGDIPVDPEDENVPISIRYQRHKAIHSNERCSSVYLEAVSGSQSEFGVLSELRNDDYATLTRLVENGALRLIIADERVVNFLKSNPQMMPVYRAMRIAVLDDKRLFTQVQDGESTPHEEDIPIDKVWDKDGLVTVRANILKIIIDVVAHNNSNDFRGLMKSIAQRVKEYAPDLCNGFNSIREKYGKCFDVLIIHQGLIDKLFPAEMRNAEREDMFLRLLQRLVPYVVITTGRGRSEIIPASARILPFMIIEEALFHQYPEKLKLVNAIFSIQPNSN